ncbi:hypothetical protein ACIRP2_19080 [Streptomyces sp. NPDC101194]|uniref:hypothetical protein n=1 Tax=Streptomyces sp. NPDC101194 TaxID=3366127 RepID=UPI00380986CB
MGEGPRLADQQTHLPLDAAVGRIGYVPISALTGRTWPLAWHFPPTAPDRFVHALLLFNAAYALLG